MRPRRGRRRSRLDRELQLVAEASLVEGPCDLVVARVAADEQSELHAACAAGRVVAHEQVHAVGIDRRELPQVDEDRRGRAGMSDLDRVPQAHCRVLVEGSSRTDPSRLRGRSRHNKTVNFTGPAAPGELVRVQIAAATSQTLSGELSLARAAVRSPG